MKFDLDYFAKNPDLESQIMWAIRGAHSNIPECCILFFISTWVLSLRKGDERNSYFKKIREVEEKCGIKANGYIPCPSCLENETVVSIHICDPKDPVCQQYLPGNNKFAKQLKKFLKTDTEPKKLKRQRFSNEDLGIETWSNENKAGLKITLKNENK